MENKRRAVPGTDDTGWTEESSEPSLTGQPGQADQPGEPAPAEAAGEDQAGEPAPPVPPAKNPL